MPSATVQSTAPANPTNGYLTKIYSSTNNLTKLNSANLKQITTVVSRVGSVTEPVAAVASLQSNKIISIPQLGANFAKRLQNMQTERVSTAPSSNTIKTENV
jgi:hypothetical protein